ncbi:MAG: DUF3616 domain-containing protein [Bryobacterales bacterium]|nr:DUF3616 domain-containing protein [Bryobacterales bacterium]
MAVAAVRLRFDGAPKKVADKIRRNISGLAFDGRNVWIGGDEGRCIERLTLIDGEYRDHKRFDLAEYLPLDTTKKQDEIDIEGIDIDDEYLWLVGSHSLRREKADPNASDEENLTVLSRITAQANRYTLARIPLTSEGDDRILVKSSATRTAAKLATAGGGSRLIESLEGDPHLAVFLPIPSKDNGLDIEGLAVQGDRAWVGLRGPVLRGWAVVLQLRFDLEDHGTLQLRQSAPTKHFLQLDGLGVRDLLLDGDDLLVLAGPTMSNPGPCHLFRWPNATHVSHDSLTWRDKLELLRTFPDEEGCDHAEAIAWRSKHELLVAYDSPTDSRLNRDDAVDLDVLLFP